VIDSAHTAEHETRLGEVSIKVHGVQGTQNGTSALQDQPVVLAAARTVGACKVPYQVLTSATGASCSSPWSILTSLGATRRVVAPLSTCEVTKRPGWQPTPSSGSTDSRRT